MRFVRKPFVFTGALAALLLASVSASAQPRRLTEAERQAVVFAAEYLDRGAAAWWDRLSGGSALRALGREAALAEIEVRAGSPAEAEWKLMAAAPSFSESGAVFALGFPSGADDSLVMGLVQENGGWKIDSLRISAEPAAAVQAAGTDGATPAPAASPGRFSALAKLPWWLLLAVGGAGALFLAAAWTERERRALAVGLGLFGTLLAGGALAAGILPRLGGAGGGAGGGGGGAAITELRALLPLRRAFTEAGGAVPESPPPESRREDVQGQVARLWWAQHRLGAMDLLGVDEALVGFPSPADIPLVELLRARSLFLRLEEVPTALAFQRAVSVGVPHEGLLLESAQAFQILGFHDHAKDFLKQLRALGSRQAETYYLTAQLAVIDNVSGEARKSFNAGWELEPIARADFFGEPALVALLEDPRIRQTLKLGAAEDPVVSCKQTQRRPIPVPAGFQARLLGETLRLRRGTAELRVPGACDLAPAGAAVDHAGIWKRERESELLARLPDLLQATRSAGALAQPALRRKAEDVARALAERQRWGEILALTESLTEEVASVPPGFVRLRAAALRRAGMDVQARDLLIRLAKGNKAERRVDPATLYQLADLLAREGSYDAAMKLVARADSLLPYDSDGERLRQLQVEKRLAASFAIHRSPHFEIRYPPLREAKFARQAADILEAERRRLQAWIPLNSTRVTTVHLLPFEDFRMGYSPDLGILGLYDGEIRLPLGNVRRFIPFIVTLMTHELAHAMLADATGDKAPRWFHEGLAQHVEMLQDNVNPIPGYRAKGNLLGFPLIDPAIGSWSPALALIGYDESRWAVHYMEQKHGKAGIQRMVAAFRDGKTTEEALAWALGKDIAEFDRALWEWGSTEAPDVWKVELVRYDEVE